MTYAGFDGYCVGSSLIIRLTGMWIPHVSNRTNLKKAFTTLMTYVTASSMASVVDTLSVPVGPRDWHEGPGGRAAAELQVRKLRVGLRMC